MEKNISKKRLVLTSIISSVCAVILVLAIIFLLFGRLGVTFLKLMQMNVLVETAYYGDTDSADFDTGVCEGYVSQLDDKYAAYYPPIDSADKFESYEGKQLGLGVTVTLNPDTGYIYVFRVSDGSPAQKAGISAGDEISVVNGVTVCADNINEIIEDIHGDAGDKKSLTVISNGISENMEITLEKFDFQSVYSRMIGQYCYIAVTEFNDLTYPQFEDAVNCAMTNGAKGLILDLMGNTGGTTDSVVKMVDYLVPRGDILSVEYYNGKKEVLYKSDKAEVNLPMAVLVNSGTASSAEILAASVRDYGKGILIGSTTYGKGIMQKTYRLIDGTAVKFTVAKYFTKSGQSYHGTGLSPDVEVTLTEQQAKYYYMLKDEENPHIQKAVEYLDSQQPN